VRRRGLGCCHLDWARLAAQQPEAAMSTSAEAGAAALLTEIASELFYQA
jgi:hypothetical protein